jgi:hypothetical protein
MTLADKEETTPMNSDRIKKDVAFLVMSCDEYADLWIPFAKLFNKYWMDCPFDRYFVSNNIPFNGYGFQSIKTGDYVTWSANVHKILTRLKEKYVYVLMTSEESMLVKSPCDTEYILESIGEFIKLNGKYLRLISARRKFTKKHNQYFSSIKKDVLYRGVCIYTVWNITVLLDLLKLDENPWEFEKNGDARTAYLDGFYQSNVDCFHYLDTIHKGKWGQKEAALIKEELPDLIIDRKILTDDEEKKLLFRRKLFRLYFNYVPLGLQKPILKILKRR